MNITVKNGEKRIQVTGIVFDLDAGIMKLDCAGEADVEICFKKIGEQKEPSKD